MLEVPNDESLELKVKDAALLPAGKHSLRDLLVQLAKVAKAAWNVKAGTIVVTPKPASVPK